VKELKVMKYQVNHEGPFSVISLNGSLSNDSLVDMKTLMKDSIRESEKGIIVNLSSVDFICSAALGIFFSINVEALESGKKFILCNLEDEIQNLLLITGVNRHLLITPSLDSAKKIIIT
jgi:anti-anti-sigma factor